jgi:hypothetical protein
MENKINNSGKVTPPVDLNKPVENPELKKAIEEVITTKATILTLDVLYRLNIANYLVATFNVDDPEKFKLTDIKPQVSFEKNSKIGMFTHKEKDGSKFLIAFTDWEEIRKFTKENVSALVMPGKELCAFILKDESNSGVRINPAGYSLTLSKPILKGIAELIDG